MINARRVLTLALGAVACSAGGTNQPDNGSGSDDPNGAAQGGTINISGGSGNTPGTDIDVGGGSSGGSDCPTTVSGVVYDPAGKLPLYNVVVYVPSTELQPIAQGAACETCDGHFSGDPVAAALTDASGHFIMENVPSGENVPLVIQIGKWRRQVTIPSVTACTETVIDDAELLRLPRNQSEGDLPNIAVVRGGSDALECLIRKIGVEDAEFTTDAEGGKVHLYASMDGTATDGTQTLAAGATLAAADTLFDSLDKLMGYDMVLLGCEGTDNAVAGRSLAQFTNVRSYADQGGRIFGSHYHNQFIYWQEHTEANPYPDVVDFASGAHGFGVDVTGTVDTSFPKGQALSDWLLAIGASPAAGQISIKDGEHTVDTILHPNAQQWITTSQDPQHAGMNVIQYFSFPTPIDGAVCGRMVFSDIHVSAGSGDSGKVAFPGGCTSTELSPQEAALAFMIFDLSSCVQPEDEEVVPPVVVK